MSLAKKRQSELKEYWETGSGPPSSAAESRTAGRKTRQPAKNSRKTAASKSARTPPAKKSPREKTNNDRRVKKKILKSEAKKTGGGTRQRAKRSQSSAASGKPKAKSPKAKSPKAKSPKAKAKTPKDTLLRLGRLEKFKCQTTDRYPVDEEWLKEDDQTQLDIQKIIDPKNYARFVNNAVKRSAGTMALPDDDRLTEERFRQLQYPFEEVKPCLTSKEYKVSGNTYKFTDGLGVLEDDGSLKLPGESAPPRVVFTPSKGRHDGGLLHWRTPTHGVGDADDVAAADPIDEIRVLLVTPEDHERYCRAWAKHWLIVSTPHETIGAARHHVIKLARHWHLTRIWMVDDSIPNTDFYRTSSASITQKSPDSPPEILITPEGAQVLHCEAFREAENFMTDRKPKLTLLGFASQRSVEGGLTTKAKHAEKNNNGTLTSRALGELRTLTNQFNERAPTSCVLVDVTRVPWDIDYDQRLPNKEDIVFAAKLVAAGKKVCMLRSIHVKDMWMSTGGCSPLATA